MPLPILRKVWRLAGFDFQLWLARGFERSRAMISLRAALFFFALRRRELRS